MANIVFNIAKGRINELALRVKNNDPANSALVLVALAQTGLEADSVLVDYDDLGSLLAASTNEATNTNYARKIITDATLGTIAPDDTNDRFELTIPTQTWDPAPAAGDTWGAYVLCYDPDTTTGTDSSVVPLLKWDGGTVPDGSSVIEFAPIAPGIFRAT